ncbi:amidase [Dacryopinax primogenitus]|uniref:Amidase n=1 Tax=Dacryopinax primogenitus (strain DJM 731) TaxID=1858805 RepID=M5GAL4_DACPD|nr:amidase [Dacryopinax primogenitus]EJU00958.1 amidase [Dacryopinax primogenitus]
MSKPQRAIPSVPSGNVEYTAKVKEINERMKAQIPASLRLSESILDNLPVDVTEIPKTCGLLTHHELAITELDATDLRDKLAQGKLTAVETVTAYGRRAAIAHQLVHCLVDFFLDETLDRAKELDQYFVREGKVVGPLHGEQVPIKGRFASGGFLSLFEISKDDCLMIKILRELGAVFYVKTNQPQSINHLETVSFHGRTLNPYNTNLTPGGSSGGESALLAMKGSPIGLGNEGGGSIQDPCAKCGLYGLRPTSNTMPKGGYLHYHKTNDGSVAATGPMCRSARDINLFFSSVRGTQPHLKDQLSIPLPWSVPDKLDRKLRIGIMMHDGVVMPQPPMLRALKVAYKKLQASDEVEVVDYLPYEHGLGYDIIREIYFEDGGATVRGMLEEGGENILPLTEWVISPPHTFEHTVLQSWNLRYRRDQYKQAYLDYWNSTGCDVILCAPFPGTANPHDMARYWGYTAIFNLLDYPGVVFPTGLKLDPRVDVAYESTEAMSEADKYFRDFCKSAAILCDHA